MKVTYEFQIERDKFLSCRIMREFDDRFVIRYVDDIWEEECEEIVPRWRITKIYHHEVLKEDA